MTAASLDRDRLAKLLGMLGSAHDGEALAAARQAERLRADAGLTWHQIVASAPTIPFPAPPREPRTDTESAVAFAVAHWALLDARDREFISSIRHQRRPLSDKQAKWLGDIVTKCRRAEARAA
jgi:hypothetical protein